ncbi:GntR family transcriptional regulator [Cribrihabitans neustonicus]|uniref:GntR family transcriptional regulator n=1 Tax=Cribrihabitans neustonicus TaxID=1429085 RepID=UPI003B5A249C
MTTPAAKSSRTTATAELQTGRAFRALVARLRDGTLSSGMFLSMPMLVEQLEMPLAAVRDAVKRAEAGGLLTVLPKRGVMVMDANAEVTRECLDLRAMFDCEGARRLAAKGHDLPLAELREAHERLRDAAARSVSPELQRQAIATDLSLHDALAGGLGSGLASRLYAENRDRVAIIQNQRPFLADRIVSAMDEHLEIIAALEARDGDRAAAAIRHHFDKTLRWWGIPAA